MDLDRTRGSSASSHAAAGRFEISNGLVWLYALTLLFSAFLLFTVQPLFTRMVLPILGGAPSVWAVALCFFQGALLLGYCYAHALVRWLPIVHAGILHLIVTAAAYLISLPVRVPTALGGPPQENPYLWQLGLYALGLGLPFVAVAATAPLLQAWFARTGHRHARDPYFLYAASNVGSLGALLGYAFVLEPLLGVRRSSGLWASGFVLLGLGVAGCLLAAVRSGAASRVAAATGEEVTSPPTVADRVGWVGLALVPAGLLTAFTTHVATDIASAPLIWVFPLAAYLLSFVLAFRDRRLLPAAVVPWAHVVATVLALLVLARTETENAHLSGAVGFVAFFLSSLVAHRTLYQARPAPNRLTEFYLLISLGGVIGGLLAALVAPLVFSQVHEYPLLLALTLACRPGLWTGPHRDARELGRLGLIAAAGLALVLLLPWALGRIALPWDVGWAPLLVVAAGFGIVFWARWPARQLALALLACAAIAAHPPSERRGQAERSYFGVYRVAISPDGAFRTLTHGTTLHGAQRIRDARGQAVTDRTPATYYHPASPMARTIEKVRARLGRAGTPGRYGIVGLGAGSLACYAEPGERWRFFEIDPTVVRIASDDRRFTYLKQCMPSPDIVIGDARLTLARQADAGLDLLIVDAFSSDAVPVHLLTAEALRLYVGKLKPDGVLALHISNHYFDLSAVVAATVALVPGLSGFVLVEDRDDDDDAAMSSDVAVLSLSKAAVDELRGIAEVRELKAKALSGWTDDYADILRPLLLMLE